MSVDIRGTTGITAPGYSGDGAELSGIGKVLQVVQGVSGVQSAFVGTSGPCGASVTIVPLSASSKVLVIVNLDGITFSTDDIGYGRFTLQRGTTSVSYFGYPRGWESHDNASGTTMGTTYLDSPATVNPITYSTNWGVGYGSPNLQINRDGAAHSRSTITVMEIGQ